MARYRYFEVPAKKGKVYKPIININLGYKKTHRITSLNVALVDSGADVCLCHADIGAWLGIQFKKKKGNNKLVIKGISGDVETYKYPEYIEIK